MTVGAETDYEFTGEAVDEWKAHSDRNDTGSIFITRSGPTAAAATER
jgi:hypothetical protein